MAPSDNSRVENLISIQNNQASECECKPGITYLVRLQSGAVCVIRSEAPRLSCYIDSILSRTHSYSIHTVRAGSHISPNISCCLSAAINLSSSLSPVRDG